MPSWFFYLYRILYVSTFRYQWYPGGPGAEVSKGNVPTNKHGERTAYRSGGARPHTWAETAHLSQFAKVTVNEGKETVTACCVLFSFVFPVSWADSNVRSKKVKGLSNFTTYSAWHEKWQSKLARYCACHEEWHYNFTKYCALATSQSRISFETSSKKRKWDSWKTVRLPQKLTVQHQQIWVFLVVTAWRKKLKVNAWGCDVYVLVCVPAAG